MRVALALIAFASAAPAAATPATTPPVVDERVFTAGSQLLAWCEEEARARFAGQGRETYQWTGRHYARGNTLHAEGTLRVDGAGVPVSCVVARGARERHAVIDVAPTAIAGRGD